MTARSEKTLATGQEQRSETISWVEIAKGIGIVAVVIGHVPSAPMNHYIFLFHMPLFFLLSGYVFRSMDSLTLFNRRLRSLMLPYLSFGILVMGIDLAASKFSGVAPVLDVVNPTADLLRLVIGGGALYGPFGAFWFLSCLFMAGLGYNFLSNRLGGRKSYVTALVIALSVALAYLIQFASQSGGVVGKVMGVDPHAIFIVPAAIFFFWVGNRCRGLPKRIAFWLLIFGAALGLSLANKVPEFDMKALLFGTPFNLFVAAGLSALVVLISIGCQHVLGLKWVLLHLGRTSLSIMALHLAVITHVHSFLPPVATILLGLLLPVVAHTLLSAWPTTRMIFLGGRGGQAPVRHPGQGTGLHSRKELK